MLNKIENIEYLEELIRSYRRSHVILTAFELGLFETLVRKNQSVDELIIELDISRRGLELLLHALVALEILQKEGNVYRVSMKFHSLLNPDEPDYLGGLISHEIHLNKRWQLLTESVRTGKSVKHHEINQEPEVAKRFINAMSNIGQRSARLFVQHLPFRGDEHVLDLGGGPGKYLKELCELYPNMQVTLCDQSETIDVAQNELSHHSDYNRMHFIRGDIFKTELGGPYDVVLLSNVIHIFGEDETLRLLNICSHYIKPKGRLLLKDMILNSDHAGPVFTTLFSLHMLLSTDTGKCYTEEELFTLMQQADFKIGKVHEITKTSRVLEGIKN
jgi:2-polyprenyl-3-methyl-5-hydroxy-6-metoxy-1,4-benzoquinol methylase